MYVLKKSHLPQTLPFFVHALVPKLDRLDCGLQSRPRELLVLLLIYSHAASYVYSIAARARCAAAGASRRGNEAAREAKEAREQV